MSRQPSGPAESRSGRAPFLVGSADRALLARLAQTLAADPDKRVVRTVGPAEAPTAIVVEMTPGDAEALAAQPGVTVEPDHPVELFGRTGDTGDQGEPRDR